jgi:5-methyltetrahydrofolate--homocysteine methyltransferase
MATVKGDVHDIGKNIVGVVLGCNNYEVIDLGVMVPCEKILDAAREKQVDMIGLSGPDHAVARRDGRTWRRKWSARASPAAADRRRDDQPRAHGGQDRARLRKPVVHVLDASRAVGVVPQLRGPFLAKLQEEYERARAQHGERKGPPLLQLEEARRRRPPLRWEGAEPARPQFIGLRALASDGFHQHGAGNGQALSASLEPIALGDLVPFIDWSPFFHTWELRGRYPAILAENVEAKKLFEEAQVLLEEIVSKNLLAARGVYGFFPANSVGDDVEVYGDESRREALATFHFLRQQMAKPADQFNHCLADYIAPKAALSQPDFVGAFAVSAGFGVEELCRKFESEHDDYNSIMTKALADRLAEAFAEFLHRRARREWGYGREENLTTEDLIRERYRGIRPAAGYPACPDHTEKWTLWKLLDVESRTGIRLTESCAMWPGASVSGLYFAHEEAKYFGVGKIGRDQTEDYHRRKGMTLGGVERWLGPYLDYEPNGK